MNAWYDWTKISVQNDNKDFEYKKMNDDMFKIDVLFARS